MSHTMTAERLLRDVQSVWDAARGTRAMPVAGDIDMTKLGTALPHVSLLDVVEGDPLDFCYRRVGEALIRDYGFDLTGRLHAAVADPDLESWPYYVAYVTCVTAGQPQQIEADTRNRKGEPVHVRGRVWPLSYDGKTVTSLLGAAMIFAAAGARA